VKLEALTYFVPGPAADINAAAKSLPYDCTVNDTDRLGKETAHEKSASLAILRGMFGPSPIDKPAAPSTLDQRSSDGSQQSDSPSAVMIQKPWGAILNGSDDATPMFSFASILQVLTLRDHA
jgi:hypothetical protein